MNIHANVASNVAILPCHCQHGRLIRRTQPCGRWEKQGHHRVLAEKQRHVVRVSLHSPLPRQVA